MKRIKWKRTIKNNCYMLSLIFKACPGVVILSFVMTILGAFESFLVNTYLYKYALNALQAGEELSSILITLGSMLFYAVFYMVCHYMADCYYELKNPHVHAYITNILHRKAVEVDLECFEQSAFYDTYVKAMGNATNCAYNVLNNVTGVIYQLINVGATGALIISIDPIFIPIALVPLLCTTLIGKRRNRIRHEYDMRFMEVARQRDYVRRTFYLNDFSKEMRLTNMYKVMFKRMRSSIAEMKHIIDTYGYKIMFFMYLYDIINYVIVYVGSIIIASFKTLVTKSMLLGDCFVIINSITGIANQFNSIGNIILSLDSNSLYIDNIRDFLEYKVKIAEDEKAPVVSEFKELELKDVDFSYETGNDKALSSINMTINRGEKIAIVGHNGAGKTTLIKLLQRLYDPERGVILLNGRSIKDYRLSSYRSMFGTVFQDYQLFAISVAENVMLRGNITPSDKENVNTALFKAGIYDKIMALENGIDSVVTKEFDSNGAVFSGGEAQKLSIARIFAGSHEIVIMDEPTSALDPIAEEEMYRNMFEACEGKTVIFISHRLSSATMADRIYMFENGKIIEQGTHEELLMLNAGYARMWHKQADTYTTGAEEVAS